MKSRCSMVKYSVSRARQKYNEIRSYLYFWKARLDGSIESLAYQARKPHIHPNQHTEQEPKLILDMCRSNPKLGMTELWSWLHQRGYSRCIERLWRGMRREGMLQRKDRRRNANQSLMSKCGIRAKHSNRCQSCP